ncbi:MAG: FAD:protein FMN transferase [Pseudomonadota bacterium]|nr:hypothetical protein [Pseudomonadales bacterium]MDY6921673.1 FAD:protein FMN transferase [Pseudomonadota bacterium]
MRTNQPVIISLMVISLLLTGCSRSEAPDLLEFSGQTMGTWYSVKVVDLPEPVSPRQVADVIQGELDNVNQKMSTYRPDSELSRLNAAPVAEPFAVSRETFTVLSKALEIWRLSQGAFDISIGPLVNLWGFGPEGRPREVPDDAAMRAAWKRVGSDRLELHVDDREVVKETDLYLDLSAIAKGFAVDQVALALEGLGIRQYLVEVGGEIRAGNSKGPDQPWRLAVEEPVTQFRQIHQVIPLANAAMATSGDYRNYFEADGQRYSHTIDPRDGRPIRHRLASVSVIMPSCMAADAWATALMVLGPEQGMALAESQNLAVYMILKTDAGFESMHSSGFRPFLE